MADIIKLEKINRNEAFRYMGLKNEPPCESLIRLTDECEKALLEAINPKFIYRAFDIEFIEEGIKVTDAPLIFKGSDIKQHLEGCTRCILMCTTLSASADKVIRYLNTSGAEKAFVADALASAAIEEVCDKAEEIIHSSFKECFYTWRFSPGYGDFPIEIQKDFINVTEADKKIGLTVSESLVLIPQKSVTAVIGVSQKEIPKKHRGCISCNMKDKCNFRKDGNHCGF